MTLAAIPLVLVVGLVSGRDDQAADDLVRFQGSWTIIESKVNGQADDVEKIRISYDITEDHFVTKGPNGKDVPFASFLFVIDLQKNPKQIDWGGKRDAPNGHGIYKLEGDKLTVVIGPKGKRPADFTCEAGSMRTLLVLKRKAAPQP